MLNNEETVAQIKDKTTLLSSLFFLRLIERPRKKEKNGGQSREEDEPFRRN